MFMNRIRLSPRLQKIADFVKPGAKVADIGTDHGYIPVYLVQNGICGHVIASDIGKGPIESAKRSGEYYGVADKIRYICAPGLNGVSENEADTIIIAGMGGETIVKILDDAKWLHDRVTLILQPQSKLEMLLEYLKKREFAVNRACLVRDAGKLYVAFTAAPGKPDEDLYLLDRLSDEPLKNEYTSLLLKKLTIRLEGLLNAKNDSDEAEKIREKIAIIQSKTGDIE